MPGKKSGGSLSQDHIDAALAEEGLASDGDIKASETPEDSSSDATADALDQAAIDAALAEAEAQPAEETAGPVAPDGQAAAPNVRKESADHPSDEVAAAMDDALGSVAEMNPAAPEPTSFELPQLETASTGDDMSSQGIDLLRDVQLNVKIELGRSRMLVDDVLRLGTGCVVELDKLAGDPVDVFVNDRLVARGEVLVLNDNFCVRINDIIQQELEAETE